MLVPEHWRLDAPVDLGAVHLEWAENVPSPTVTGGESETCALRPLHSSGRQYSRYHHAMHDLDRPRLSWAANAATAIRKTADHYNVKALTTGTLEVPTVVETEVQSIPQQPRRLVDALVNRQAVTGNEFGYKVQTVRDSRANIVGDTQTKPESDFTTEARTGYCRVIAHVSGAIPERVLVDHAELSRFLDQEMREGVLQRLEAEVLSGDGSQIVVGDPSSAHLTGILNTSGVEMIPFSSDLVTTIRSAVTNRQMLNETPTGWLFHPQDMQAIDLLADAQNRYYGSALNGSHAACIASVVNSSNRSSEIAPSRPSTGRFGPSRFAFHPWRRPTGYLARRLPSMSR